MILPSQKPPVTKPSEDTILGRIDLRPVCRGCGDPIPCHPVNGMHAACWLDAERKATRLLRAAERQQKGAIA